MDHDVPIQLHTHALLINNPPTMGLVFSLLIRDRVPGYTPVEQIGDTFYYLVTVNDEFCVESGRFDYRFAEIASYIQPLQLGAILTISGQLRGMEKLPSMNVPQTIFQLARGVLNT